MREILTDPAHLHVESILRTVSGRLIFTTFPTFVSKSASILSRIHKFTIILQLFTIILDTTSVDLITASDLFITLSGQLFGLRHSGDKIFAKITEIPAGRRHRRSLRGSDSSDTAGLRSRTSGSRSRKNFGIVSGFLQHAALCFGRLILEIHLLVISILTIPILDSTLVSGFIKTSLIFPRFADLLLSLSGCTKSSSSLIN